MKVAIGADHAGFPLKQTVMDAVRAAGHEPIDLGTYSTEAVDYPDFTEKVGRAILDGQAERGIMLCGSAVGANIAANKMHGIYAGICHDTYSARQGVEHDDMNLLCLGARIIGPEPAKEIVAAFLRARFVGNDPGEERHKRRVGKVRKIEEG
jgi:ribose 5-phosphate isomerase B